MLVTYTHLVEHNENPKINITADMYIQPFSAAHQHSYPPWAGSQIELRIWKVVSPVKFPSPTNLTAVSSYFYPWPPWDPSQALCPSQILVNRRKISIPQILASLFIQTRETHSKRELYYNHRWHGYNLTFIPVSSYYRPNASMWYV